MIRQKPREKSRPGKAASPFFLSQGKYTGYIVYQEDRVMATSLDDSRLKALLKETILELLSEHREEFSLLLLEVLEDLALSRAIREGEASGEADRQKILEIMAGQA
ncbi:MAG: hypothetical protein ACUVXF_05845 [Desulfobaccales bacterium]